MIDAVLSYHLNPQTCGVAKFNHALAKRLGVPCLSLDGAGRYIYKHPLVSIKTMEMQEPNGRFWHRMLPNGHFDLLLHDYPTHADRHIKLADRVFAANAVLAERLRAVRPDVAEAFCPSTIMGNPHRGSYRVLVFGMAHKLDAPHFRKLKRQLAQEHPDYTIELSTAVHEGSPWDVAMAESVETMREVFGKRLRVLGFLGDDAMAKELREVDAVACYFEPALRANNTSYWAAVEAGKKVYTNRDEFSPKEGDPPVTWDALVALIKGAA